jgi:threonine/homoserine/homoserine lactone efflux protein
MKRCGPGRSSVVSGWQSTSRAADDAFVVYTRSSILGGGVKYFLQSEIAMNWMSRAFAASFAGLGLKPTTEGSR